MSTTAQHTPTPWEQDGLRINSENGSTGSIASCADVFVREGWSGTDYATKSYAAANAAFIVRACNSHDQLLAALREANELLKQNGIGLDDTADYGNGRTCDIMARIHSALAAGGAA